LLSTLIFLIMQKIMCIVLDELAELENLERLFHLPHQTKKLISRKLND